MHVCLHLMKTYGLLLIEYTYIINYGLIAKATITFSKQNGTATKGGQLLYEDGY